jgi:hypothetical protein
VKYYFFKLDEMTSNQKPGKVHREKEPGAFKINCSFIRRLIKSIMFPLDDLPTPDFNGSYDASML